MYFNLISDLETYNPFFFKDGLYLLYDSLEKAIKENAGLNILDHKINQNSYWSENSEEFVKDFLSKNKLPIKPLLELNDFNYEIVIKEDKEWLFLKEGIIYSLDESFASYFNEEIILADETEKIELRLKTIGYLTPFKLVIDKLKEYFGKEYKYYILQIYDFIKNYEVKFSEDKFINIIQSKKILNSIKIRNIIEGFDYKKDKYGKYLEIEYSDSVTGRLYGSELQTLAKEKKKNLIARDGFYLIEFDFVCFEFNILLDILKLPKPKDPHLDILSHLGLDVDRNIGKKINYAFIFGMNINKIVLNILNEYGIMINKERLENYPPFKKKLDLELSNGIILTYFGRPIHPEKSYAILNNYIQSTAADIFFSKFIRINSLLEKSESSIITQNHDSILLEVSKRDIEKTNLIEKIKDILKESMGEFTFEVEMKYGKTWGEMK